MVNGTETKPGKIPTVMRSLELAEYGGELRIAEKPTPQPGPGEVLIRMAFSPINPSDLYFLQGTYGIRKPLPVVPGFEGSGTVVAAGEGLVPHLWMGRRVACAASTERNGTWAEYMVTQAMMCVPLLNRVSLEQGATMLVNPMTAWALMDMARSGGHPAAANTAGASALGRMLLRLSLRYHYPFVHIVRRQSQVDILRAMGATHVLNSSNPEFEAQLHETFHSLGVTIAFDAVAGEMTGRLLAAMPTTGRVVVYGILSEAAVTLHPGSFIFEKKTLDGFWLSEWLPRLNPVRLLQTAYSVQRLLSSELQTAVYSQVSLEEGIAGLKSYVSEMTRGKILIKL
jgi:NADPH:quinone reductase